MSVIVDTNMCHARTWENVDSVQNENPQVIILPIILECSLETHGARIEHRGKTNLDHLNLGGEKFEDTLHKYEYIKNLNRPDLVRINANGDRESVYNSLLETIKLVYF